MDKLLLIIDLIKSKLRKRNSVAVPGTVSEAVFTGYDDTENKKLNIPKEKVMLGVGAGAASLVFAGICYYAFSMEPAGEVTEQDILAGIDNSLPSQGQPNPPNMGQQIQGMQQSAPANMNQQIPNMQQPAPANMMQNNQIMLSGVMGRNPFIAPEDFKAVLPNTANDNENISRPVAIANNLPAIPHTSLPVPSPSLPPVPSVPSIPKSDGYVQQKNNAEIMGISSDADGNTIAIMNNGDVVSAGETFSDGRIAWINDTGVGFENGEVIGYK